MLCGPTPAQDTFKHSCFNGLGGGAPGGGESLELAAMDIGVDRWRTLPGVARSGASQERTVLFAEVLCVG